MSMGSDERKRLADAMPLPRELSERTVPKWRKSFSRILLEYGVTLDDAYWLTSNLYLMDAVRVLGPREGFRIARAKLNQYECRGRRNTIFTKWSFDAQSEEGGSSMTEILKSLIKLEELLDTDMAPEFTDQAIEDEIEKVHDEIQSYIDESNLDKIYMDEKLSYAINSLRTALGLQEDPGANKETAKRQFTHFIELLKSKL